MNRVIGIILGVIFLCIFTGNTEWFPEFFQLKDSIQSYGHSYTSTRASEGILTVYLTAATGVYFLVLPNHAMRLLSPKNSFTNRAILTEGMWVIFGYMLVGLSFGILNLFKSSI